MTILKLAWRNIWRNKRRTYITSASIILAVLLSSLMVAIQKGAWDKMIDNIVNFYYGYAQVHKQGYWDDQTIDNAFEFSADLISNIESNTEIINAVPRIESFALASADQYTFGVLVVGTDPESEKSMTALDEKVIRGKYFNPNNEEVLLAVGAAEKLNLDVNDTLVLISQGYHGVNAAGKYPIAGIIEFGSPDLNKNMVYLPLNAAQYFFGANNMITALALNLKNGDNVKKVVNNLKQEIPTDQYEIMNWEELMPELVEARVVDAAGNYVVMLVLYIIIGFGIFGTILMMTKEREYEFGVLTSIGMNRRKLFFGVWLEVMLLGLLGAGIGILLSYPLVYYFNINPIDLSGVEGMAEAYEDFGFEPVLPAAVDWQIFFSQAVIIAIITTILALYPFFKIMKLKPVEAMRQ